MEKVFEHFPYSSLNVATHLFLAAASCNWREGQCVCLSYYLICWRSDCLARSSHFSPLYLFIPSLNLFIVHFVLSLALFIQRGDGSHSSRDTADIICPKFITEGWGSGLERYLLHFSSLLWIQAIFPAVKLCLLMQPNNWYFWPEFILAGNSPFAFSRAILGMDLVI